MNSKILIIAIAIAVIATVFMGCANNKNDITTTTLPSSQTTVSDTNTTDKAESEASSAVSKAGEKADKVGDDIGKGANGDQWSPLRFPSPKYKKSQDKKSWDFFI